MANKELLQTQLVRIKLNQAKQITGPQRHLVYNDRVFCAFLGQDRAIRLKADNTLAVLHNKMLDTKLHKAWVLTSFDTDTGCLKLGALPWWCRFPHSSC